MNNVQIKFADQWELVNKDELQYTHNETNKDPFEITTRYSQNSSVRQSEFDNNKLSTFKMFDD